MRSPAVWGAHVISDIPHAVLLVFVLVPVSWFVPVSDKDFIGHDRFWE